MNKAATASRRVFRCSFCSKPQDKVVKLIAGPGVMICNECVNICVPIMAAEPTTSMEPESIITPDKTPTEQLLAMLAGYNTAFESIDRTMQDIVNILRQREISWAVLGEKLGVSRQAAWKRFG